jgi:hypothetical protein
MFKKIILVISLMVLLNPFTFSQQNWATLPSQGSGSEVAPSASITFTNIDSVNDSYSQWTSELAYFMGGTTGTVNSLIYKYAAPSANDSIFFQIEGRIAGNNNLIIRCYSLLMIGATTPVTQKVTLTDSANCDQYRIKLTFVPTSAPNVSTNDLDIGFGTNQMPYIAPRKKWTTP